MMAAKDDHAGPCRARAVDPMLKFDRRVNHLPRLTFKQSSRQSTLVGASKHLVLQEL